MKTLETLSDDNECENDYLGTTVYAEALARRILNVPTPLTIGVFARWGSGKSFLLNKVEGLFFFAKRPLN